MVATRDCPKFIEETATLISSNSTLQTLWEIERVTPRLRDKREEEKSRGKDMSEKQCRGII